MCWAWTAARARTGCALSSPASTSPASTRPRRTSIPPGPTGWKPRWRRPASLPFADSAFPSVWAVDALAGLPPEEWDDVVRELERVAAPGAPIAVVLPETGLRGTGDQAGTGLHGAALPRLNTPVDLSVVVVLAAARKVTRSDSATVGGAGLRDGAPRRPCTQPRKTSRVDQQRLRARAGATVRPAQASRDSGAPRDAEGHAGWRPPARPGRGPGSRHEPGPNGRSWRRCGGMPVAHPEAAAGVGRPASGSASPDGRVKAVRRSPAAASFAGTSVLGHHGPPPGRRI